MGVLAEVATAYADYGTKGRHCTNRTQAKGGPICSIGITPPLIGKSPQRDSIRMQSSRALMRLQSVSPESVSVWTLARLCNTCHTFLHFSTSQRLPCYLIRKYLTDMIRRQRFDPIGSKNAYSDLMMLKCDSLLLLALGEWLANSDVPQLLNLGEMCFLQVTRMEV